MANFPITLKLSYAPGLDKIKQELSTALNSIQAISDKKPIQIKVKIADGSLLAVQKEISALIGKSSAVSKSLPVNNSTSSKTQSQLQKQIHDLEQFARIANTANRAQEFLKKNAEALGNTRSYRKLQAGLQDLRKILTETNGDAKNLDSVLQNMGKKGQTAVVRTTSAIADMNEQLRRTGMSGATSLREITTLETQLRSTMSAAIKKNPTLVDTQAFKNAEATANSFRKVLEMCSGNAKQLGNALRSAGQDGANAANNARNIIASLRNEMQRAAKAPDTQAMRSKILKEYNNVVTQGTRNLQNWTRAEHSRNASSREAYAAIKTELLALRQLYASYQQGATSITQLGNATSRFAASMRKTRTTLVANGDATRTFADQLKGLAQNLSYWTSGSAIIMYAVRTIRQMIDTSIELDSAMTQMQIVTRASAAEMEGFGDKAAETAKRIGSSINDFVSSATVFARLGYNMEQSSALAEYTAMLQNVGDIDVSDAQNAITAIIKAFSINDIDEMKSVMDKLVTTGNNFPISVAQIAEGMNNASSALQAAGNTFEQTVALLTAANTTVQNASKSSTAMRTIAARIRNTKTELDELGEEMTDATYEELVSALTNANVAITDVNGEFRSTYDIIADLAKIWDDLPSMEQAALAKAIAGVRQQSIFYSLVENFEEASGAMDAMAESAGALDTAYATYMDSVQAHINQFKTAFEGLSQSTFSKDFLIDFIDIGTALVSIINKIATITNQIGGLRTVLVAVLGIIATIYAQTIQSKAIAFFGNMKTSVTSLITTLRILGLEFSDNLQGSVKNFGKATSATFKLLATEVGMFQLVLAGVTIALTAAVAIYSKYKQEQQEAHDAAVSNAQAASTLSEELSSLTSKYAYLNKAVETDDSVKEDLLATQNELIDKLGLEQYEIDGLIRQYGNLTEAIKHASAERLKLLENDIRAGTNEYEKDLIQAARPSVFSGNSLNEINAYWGGTDAKTQARNEAAVKALAKAGYVSANQTGVYGVGIHLDGTGEYDLSTVEGVINAHERLADMMSVVVEQAGSENDVFKALSEQYNSVSEEVNNYNNSVEQANSLAVQRVMLERLVGQEFPKSQEAFDKFKQGMIVYLASHNTLVGVAAEDVKDIENIIDSVLSKEAEFSDFYNNQSSPFTALTDGATAYANALNNVPSIADEIDKASESLTTLAKLQDEVSNGFVISADKAMEFAKVYPEILEGATLSADGQIQLNSDVVNSFIEGKQAEINSQIDADIAKLQGEKEVLEGKVALAQAELDLARGVVEGKGELTQEEAIYRINAANALLRALIEAGVKESDAYKIVCASMAQNQNEFDTVAAEVFGNVSSNASSSAYSMAQAFFLNSKQSVTSLSAIAQQARKAAIAIKGMLTGEVSGDGSPVGVGGGGVSVAGKLLSTAKNKVKAKHAKNLQNQAKVNLIKGGNVLGNFTGADLSYEPIANNLEDFITSTQADLDNNLRAIAQIDGQIAALEAIRARPLSSYLGSSGSGGSGSGNKGGSGSGNKGSGSALKEIEEYFADIDEYYAAQKRLESIALRMSETQAKLDVSDNDYEKVALTRELIETYKEQADALEHLNTLRSATIANGAEQLRALGFEVQYNAETNELYIDNLDHINELQAESAGEYKTVEEATNALRKDTEELANSMESLNKANQEGVDSMRQVRAEVINSNKEIIDYLNNLVKLRHDLIDLYQNVYDSLQSAADEYAANGFITIDTLQTVLNLGTQYLQYLTDENGMLVINRERIEAMIAARTQELAVEQAATYVERLRLAMQKDSVEDLNNLLYATVDTTDATWDYVYAQLATLGLGSDQYEAALHNINAIRSLADNAVQSIGRVAGETTEKLNKMKSGLDDILKYTMDMLKQRINDQIDALKEMEKTYGDIIAKRKESLEEAKKESDYQKSTAKRISQIAKIQAKINALALDDSREAKAQRVKLEEELAELQDGLAEDQSTHAREVQEGLLDDMQKSYEEEKEEELKILEDSISSYEKLYRMAINYIQDNWDTLYEELIDWNTEYGSVLNSEITSAWDACLEAAQRYGSYISALNSIDADISASSGETRNDIVSRSTNNAANTPNNEAVHEIIKEMYHNASTWTPGDTTKAQRNIELGERLSAYGINAVRNDQNGIWYVDRVGGEKLFTKYAKYIYHSGGIAGDSSTPKQDEVMAVLKKGEPVLDKKREQGLYRIVDFIQLLSSKVGSAMSVGSLGGALLSRGAGSYSPGNALAAVGGAYSFSPNINVNINHNGSLSENDAKRYGRLAADSALKELSDAFSKRGISTIGNSAL